MRVVAGNVRTLKARHEDDEGTLTTAGEVTVTVVDGAGAEILEVEATESPTGVYSFELPAQELYDLLTVTWKSDTWTHVDVIDVVGARLLSFVKMKAVDELSDKTVDELDELLDDVETRFEDMLGYPPVPVGLRLSAEGDATRLLLRTALFPRALYSVVKSDDTAIDVDGLVLRPGWIETTDGAAWYGTGRVRIHLAHGLERPLPDIAAAALDYARWLSRKPDRKIPQRATRIISQDVDMTLGKPDNDHPTGLPDVDEVLVRRRVQLPV